MIDFKVLGEENKYHINFSHGLNYPLDVFFLNKNGTTSWSTQVFGPGSWVQSPSTFQLNIRIIDNEQELIFSYDSIFNDYSDIVEKKFISWCRNFLTIKGIKPKGLAIGTNDGSSGEWVEAYQQNLIGPTLLVEPNLNSFLQLTNRYSSSGLFNFKKCVVSEIDGFVDFYTNEDETNEASSLLKNHFLNHQSSYKTIKVKSVRPSNLFNQENIPDWVHIDAEGYDGKIILLFEDFVFQKVTFFMWEHIHLTEEMTQEIYKRLEEFNFIILKGSVYNTCAYKWHKN
jgi:FkbM family methyltransferase